MPYEGTVELLVGKGASIQVVNNANILHYILQYEMVILAQSKPLVTKLLNLLSMVTPHDVHMWHDTLRGRMGVFSQAVEG